MKSDIRYITRDCSGHALQYTGSGEVIQVKDDEADSFETQEDAESALEQAGETGGYTDLI